VQKQEIFLGLGSNIGDKKSYLKKACDLIEQEIGQIIGFSSLYITQPWGNTNQEKFINQVIRLIADVEPKFLLDKVAEIENSLGRVRDVNWGPRTIDIDILYFGKYVIDRESLQIPHPELTERKFVLVPLVEIAPNFVHPIFKLSNKELLEFCTDTLVVTKI
jgi:2-amino-4-hydroxy-6-hydroxymethyldihydropteridine diphosphokinase